MRMIVILFAFLTCVLSPVATFAFVEYDIIDLGAGTAGMSINNLGQVVGSEGAPGYYPFYWDKVTGKVSLPTYGSGYASAINDSGYIVGTEYVGGSHYASYWDLSRQLHILLSGTSSMAYALNNNNIAAGANSPDRATTWNIVDNTIQGLGMPTSSYARGINDLGQVVGYVGGGDSFRAFLYENGAVKSLGSLGGSETRANAINNLSQIVGADYSVGAFLWQNNQMEYLGSIGGWTYAFGINDLSEVVGRDYSMGHAFIWDEENGIRDLNELVSTDLGWILDYAYDINESGQITGFGYLNGVQHGYVLTPAAATVPEPASLSLLGIGIAGLLMRKRRK